MTYIDIHNHIDFYSDEKVYEIIEECKKLVVSKILINGVDLKSNKKIIQLSEKYKEIKPCLGIYPVEGVEMSKKEFQENLNFIRKDKNKIAAIGEVGLDLKEISELKPQLENFKRIINLAKEINKPVIIHTRKAEEEVLNVLEELEINPEQVILHCFMAKKNLIKTALEKGYNFTIPTSVNNSEHFQRMIEVIPLEQLFCETDSPFLHPLKQKDNTPANILYSYKKISEIKKLSLKEVEKQIENNFERVFE